jgi:tetratricopeptide (TPR) repeat protein
MKKPLLWALLGLTLATPAVHAQSPGTTPPTDARRQGASNAQLFYQVLLGEMNAANGETGAAVSLLLDAARKTQDERLYQRAADLALGARAGESALQVARSWREAHPKSLEASRYVLQILLAMNRVGDSGEALRAVIELTAEPERPRLLNLVPALYARASDKKLAASVGEQALAGARADPKTADAALAAIGRLRLAAGETAAALEAARRALQAQPRSQAGVDLALELMNPRLPQAEALVRQYLDAAPGAAAEVRLNYARNLLDVQRYAESALQLEQLTREQAQFAEGWLLLGSLQMDQAQGTVAQASLQRYLGLARAQAAQDGSDQRVRRGMAQAHLMLAQIAERQGDLAQAQKWLAEVKDPELLVQTQSRRASLLARQGQLAQARALLQQLPEPNAQEARRKMLAEVNLLREFKQYQPAYELMSRAVAQTPKDHELIYEKSILAEKLGRFEEMESLLRQILQLKPDYHAAYNALGYSLADRGVRLAEAKQLIVKALEFAPSDPYIQDSLAWVEFRLGNRQEALRVIEAAYKAKPDAEIAAHFGEILWSLGQRERALMIWREGLQLNADNDTLQETLKRLQVQP